MAVRDGETAKRTMVVPPALEPRWDDSAVSYGSGAEGACREAACPKTCRKIVHGRIEFGSGSRSGLQPVPDPLFRRRPFLDSGLEERDRMLRYLRWLKSLASPGRLGVSILALALLPVLPGCPESIISQPAPTLSNTTDPTNGGAEYLGAATCQACHPQVGALHSRHGHSQILHQTQGAPVQYSSTLPQTGVPQPPPGQEWTGISFVIGGYAKAAQFVDRDGFLLTDAGSANPLQFNLPLAVIGSEAGFVPSAGTAQTPYSFDCFRCHTTGPQTFEASGLREDNLPGIGGHWAEEGVQCEACHGPGSRHVPNPSAGNIFLDPTNATCARCHSSGTGQVLARDGYIIGNQQVEEVNASPHASFTCTVCHNPHASTFAQPDVAIRNDCQVCHSDMNMALHDGLVFTRGEYTETLTCRSCHMTFAGRYAQSAPPGFAGPAGRIGDTRTHVVVINSDISDFTGMFKADGSALARDANGRAFVTVDFVCLRCHNGQGGAFELSADRAAEIASQIHTPQ